MRVLLLGAFGDPGHAFPMIALGRALRARGHEVTLQTWRRWQAHVEAEGLRFAPAPEYDVFPSGGPGGEPLDFYEAVVHATQDTLPLVRELRPDAVVADILTLAPSLAAELCGIPRATLIPHVYPENEPNFPIYSFGARLPRTAAGRALWRRAQGPIRRGVELGRVELNRTRARLGLPPLDYGHGGISRELALVATFPQLEYPREWPPWAHVVGPLMWEPPARDVELPATEHTAQRAGWAAAPSTIRSSWSPPRPPRTPTIGCYTQRCAVSPTRRCACWRPGTAACPRARCPCPPTHESSSGSPTRAPCRFATSSSATPATARSCARWRPVARSSRARTSAT